MLDLAFSYSTNNDPIPPGMILASPAVASFAATIAGLWLKNEKRWNVVSWWLLGIWSFFLLVVFIQSHERGVSTANFIGGIAFGLLLMGLLPFIGFYSLGRALTNGWIAIVAWAALLVPLYFFFLYVGLGVFAAISCPAGAYECPV